MHRTLAIDGCEARVAGDYVIITDTAKGQASDLVEAGVGGARAAVTLEPGDRKYDPVAVVVRAGGASEGVAGGWPVHLAHAATQSAAIDWEGTIK